jgi:ATP-binding cassette subfamily F protein 3
MLQERVLKLIVFQFLKLNLRLMLSVSNITVEFGGYTLFSDISFLINKGDRIGLVGKNGAGKSTMLKIISGVQKPSNGSVAMQNNLAVGYLPQEMAHQSGKTVFDEAATAFDEIKKLKNTTRRN